jgi:hypothetical protein
MLPLLFSPPSRRSEAFAEDLFGEMLADPAGDVDTVDAITRWTTLIAPFAVVLLSVVFAVIPPLA